MNMPSRIPTIRRRQRGVVAIILGIVIVVLIAFIGLALDIGHLYNRKVELQNAADAAALAGARELNGTAAGVTVAAAQAIALAAANRSDFGATPVAITNAEIAFGSSPDGPWMSVAQATADPANMFFIEVDTSGIEQGRRPTWFMRAVSAAFADTTTFGRAVAGPTFCEGLPFFTCPRPDGTAPNYGFVKGTSYRLAYTPAGEIGPGKIGLMDPRPPDAPKLIIGTDEMRDVLCFGKTYCLAAPGTYTTLTQNAFNPMMDALNTRFNIYQGVLNNPTYKLACPSDTNIKNYGYNTVDGDAPVDWLASPAVQQSLDEIETVVSGEPRIVHWAGVRPNSGDTPSVSGSYPPAGSGATGDFSGTPYGQTSGSYFEAPPSSATTQAGRRIITIGIASGCPLPGGSGNPVHIATFARFLMQRTAIDTGGPSNRGMFLEFIEMVSAPPSVIPEIKLYR